MDLNSSGVIVLFDFSDVDSPSKQVRVTFNQNIESSSNNERYEYTFGAYLEVRKSFSVLVFLTIEMTFVLIFRMHILVSFVVVLLVDVGLHRMMERIHLRIRSSENRI